MTVALASTAFWLVLLTLYFVAEHSWSGAYTGLLAAALWAEVQHRMGEL